MVPNRVLFAATFPLIAIAIVLCASDRASAQSPVRQASVYSQHLPSGVSDYAGAGENRFLRGDDRWRAYAYYYGVSAVSTVRIQVPENDFGDEWTFQFSTNQTGEPLVPGVYEGAIQFSFVDPCTVAVDVGEPGRACGRATGRFEILDAVFDYDVPPGEDPRVVRFAAKFEQYCDGSPLGLFGSIYYDSPVVPDGPVPMIRSVEYTRGSGSFNSGLVVRGRHFGVASTLLIDGEEAFFNQFDPRNSVSDGLIQITKTTRLSPGQHTVQVVNPDGAISAPYSLRVGS